MSAASNPSISFIKTKQCPIFGSSLQLKRLIKKLPNRQTKNQLHFNEKLCCNQPFIAIIFLFKIKNKLILVTVALEYFDISLLQLVPAEAFSGHLKHPAVLALLAVVPV